MAYVILFGGTLLMSSFFSKKRQCKRIRSVGFYVFVVIIMALFLGLRGLDVGSDTGAYKYYYEVVKAEGLNYVFRMYQKDIGFFILNYVLSFVTPNYSVYLIITSLIYLIPVAILVYKKSVDTTYSLFLFYCFGLFTLALSTLRQVMAIGLCIIAYLIITKRLLTRQNIIALLLVLVASTVHYSALCFLLFMFLRNVKISRKSLLVMITAMIICLFSSEIIRDFYYIILTKGNFEAERYATTSVGGYGMILFLAGIFLLSVLVYFRNGEIRYSADTEKEIICLYIALLLFITSRFNLAVMRVYLYYFIYTIIIIPNTTGRIKNVSTKRFVNICVIVAAICFLLFDVFVNPYSKEFKLLPYMFIWS